MFPIRDLNPAQRRPYVTYALIAANVAIWGFAWLLGPVGIEAFVVWLGVVPRKLLALADPLVLMTPLTSMFMHGSWAHLIGNMWFLHVFGDNVEDHLGHARFAVFYVLAGLCAVATHLALSPFGTLPLVGASGAIAGVLGAYMIRYPRAPILTWVGFFLVEVPAFVFLFVWFGYQLLMTVGTVGFVEAGGVAFAAHAGGFVAGVVLDPLLGPSRAEIERRRAARAARWQQVRRARSAPRSRWFD